MKIHLNLVQAVAHTLEQIFNRNAYADKAIEKLLKSNPKWGARDRAFLAQTTYDIVRFWRYLLFLCEIPYKDYKNTYYTTDFYTIIAVYFLTKGNKLPEWEIFNKISWRKVYSRMQNAEMEAKISHSVPDWLNDLAWQELAELWHREIAILNQPAEVVLRANTLLIQPKDLQSELRNFNIETELLPNYPEALLLKNRQNIFKNPLFLQGLFEVQDASSQCVAHFLDVKPSHTVIDACAGAGGKTLHLAALMQNKGRILALDTEAWKLQELKRRARRAQAFNIETRPIDSLKTIKKLAQKADRLLLDVPCSGLGVLRRNPDAKWKLSLDFLDKVREKQQYILQNYSPMLKKGGKMVYATCSILPSENHEQVKKFLASEAGKEFFLRNEQTILPSQSGFDGFYMALLERKA
ncbi:MAG: RsmB/NOP family class I SAM-dependent RNA methyltransferase [Microscillaceae bacterium]|nr:RsmB/NOP family class I SAM-dependent RNA methyltransferase [Microscillaceae bacterium]MDW8460714.1 RsmB/NOP family class I SAM-dependent RNA methyltransferase [Cytophagales bacterium]